MKYKVLVFSLVVTALCASVRSVSAHVVVKPNTAGIGAFQIFTMSVPSEKDIPTVALKLTLPDGLSFVTPNVKPGWKVEVKNQATGKKIADDDGAMVDEMKPVEINWTGGSIPSGQRDEFSFQAQAPATPATLAWKAFQTYSDGSVEAWDQTPGVDVKNPYSQTSIIDDLSASMPSWWSVHALKLTMVLSIIAIVLSVCALMNKKTALNS